VEEKLLTFPKWPACSREQVKPVRHDAQRAHSRYRVGSMFRFVPAEIEAWLETNRLSARPA